MADKKISQLDVAEASIGTEELPIVQSSATKKTTVANLTAGRVVEAKGYTLGADGVVNVTGTTRTLSGNDNGKVIYCTSASAVTITTAEGFGTGFCCAIIQGGDGQVSVVAGGATTVNGYSGLTKTVGKYAIITVFSPASNEFLLAGNLGT